MDNTNNDEGGKKAPGVMGPPIGGRSQDFVRGISDAAGRGRGRKQSEPIPSWSRSDRTRCAWCMKQLDFNPIRATSPQSSVVSCSGGCETNYCSMQHRDQDFERHKPFCSLHIPSSSCSNSTPAMTRLGANTTDDVLQQSETSWRKASHDTSSSSGYRSGGNSFVMSSSERSLGLGDCLVPVSSWSDIAGTDKTPLSLGALHETQTSDSDFLSVRFASSPNQRSEIERNTQNAAAESHTDNIEIIDATKSTSQTSSCAVDHSLNQPHVEPGEPDIGLVNATNSGNVQRLKRLAEHATTCLQLYGWSVLDKFIGAHNCANVLIDVQSIRDRGLLMPGQLMGGGPMGDAATTSYDLRSDLTFWFDAQDGKMAEFEHVRLLISCMDTVATHCSQRIAPLKIGGRTKAMIACYPGNGSKYVRHVDNPNHDGRCVTFIYYMNQHWIAQTDGGVLRLYPSTFHTHIDIEPIADRLLIFWSDIRNPHEVMPVHRPRFALTIWYFDETEKAEMVARLAARQNKT